MKNYVLYRQVQQRLDRHAAETGAPFSFYEAARELLDEGAGYEEVSEMPDPCFDKWDVTDLDGFCDCMMKVPVSAKFFQNEQYMTSRTISERESYYLDRLPIKIAENQAVGLHQHSAFELLYVLRGRAKFHTNDAIHQISVGSLYFTAPNFCHEIAVDDGAIAVSIMFWEHTVDNTLYRLLESKNTIADFFRTSLSPNGQGYMLFTLPVTEVILRIIRDIFHEGYSGQRYAMEICTNCIEILFSHLLRHYAREIDRDASKEGSGASPMLSVLQYMQDHYRDLSLAGLAERFHYEPDYLGRKIKRLTGKNFTGIMNDLRIGRACALLRDTNLSVEQVAEAAGYRSREYFTCSFKTQTGLAPGAYRNANRSGLET